MAQDPNDSLTRLIEAAREGDDVAISALFTEAYDELRQLAHVMRRSEAGGTLSTVTLVHEAYAKLVPSSGLSIESRAHFKHIVGRAMRQVLVDRARARSARKRGGSDAIAVTLQDDEHGAPAEEVQLVQIIQLHDALEELERVDSRSARVVECRFFGGLDVEETAIALEISTATVKRDWRVARAWLAKAMG